MIIASICSPIHLLRHPVHRILSEAANLELARSDTLLSMTFLFICVGAIEVFLFNNHEVQRPFRHFFGVFLRKNFHHCDEITESLAGRRNGEGYKVAFSTVP